MLRAGVVGLGQMGGGAAVCLARAGRPLAVYDIDPEAWRKLDDGELLPPVAANSAEVARRSDVVIVLVVDAAQAWSVLDGPDGLLAGAEPGLAIVVASTIAMEELAKMRARAAQAGVIIVDCGVTCPPGGHAHKRIVGMVGADPAIYDRIRPVLADFTQAAPRMGGPGAGMATKIVRNMMFYTTWLAAAEASRLAAQADIDIEQMAVINALSEADASGPTMWLQSAASRDAVPGGATARFEHVRDVMLKDLNAAARLAGEYDVELPLIELMREKADAIVSPWR